MKKIALSVAQVAIGLLVGCAASDAVNIVGNKIQKVVDTKKGAGA